MKDWGVLCASPTDETVNRTGIICSLNYSKQHQMENKMKKASATWSKFRDASGKVVSGREVSDQPAVRGIRKVFDHSHKGLKKLLFPPTFNF